MQNAKLAPVRPEERAKRASRRTAVRPLSVRPEERAKRASRREPRLSFETHAARAPQDERREGERLSFETAAAQPPQDERGITLIEIMLALVINLIILQTILTFSNNSLTVFQKLKSMRVLRHKTMLITNQLEFDLRNATHISVDPTTNAITINRVNGVTHLYYQTKNILYMRDEKNINHKLADGVTNMKIYHEKSKSDIDIELNFIDHQLTLPWEIYVSR